MARNFHFEYGTARAWGSFGYAIGAFFAGIFFSISPHINFWLVSLFGAVFMMIDLIMLATERRDLGLDDGSFWPVLEGIPATEMFKVIPLSPGHAYGMFMERFNELSELRKCA